MGNLIDIRRRIKSTKNTQQITKAMKLVSASRLRKASERAMNARPYAEKILEVHGSILARLPETNSPMYRQSKGKTLILAIAGDKGLCGSFNSNIFKHVMGLVHRVGVGNAVVMPIGKKSGSFFAKQEVSRTPGYSEFFRHVTVSMAETITKDLVDRFLAGEFAQVVLVYNKFRNVLIQEVTESALLPLGKEENGGVTKSGAEHLAEPGLEEILQELSPRVVLTQLLQALLESCASEHAARMTAMDSATKNAKDMIESLTLDMNKARQAAITKELIEVVSGAAAL